ncbi:hypothetical protein ABIB51_001777 [Arthrobacter sp. UYCu712]
MESTTCNGAVGRGFDHVHGVAGRRSTSAGPRAGSVAGRYGGCHPAEGQSDGVRRGHRVPGGRCLSVRDADSPANPDGHRKSEPNSKPDAVGHAYCTGEEIAAGDRAGGALHRREGHQRTVA